MDVASYLNIEASCLYVILVFVVNYAGIFNWQSNVIPLTKIPVNRIVFDLKKHSDFLIFWMKI